MKQILKKARFEGEQYERFDHEDIMSPSKNSEQTIYLQIYLTKKQTPNVWKSIFHKGLKNMDRTIAVWLCPDRNALHCRVSTKTNSNDGFDSIAILQQNQLYKLAFVLDKNNYCLYVNGLLDTKYPLNAEIVTSTGPL